MQTVTNVWALLSLVVMTEVEQAIHGIHHTVKGAGLGEKVGVPFRTW